MTANERWLCEVLKKMIIFFKILQNLPLCEGRRSLTFVQRKVQPSVRCAKGWRSRLLHNGLGLGEEGELKVQMLNKPQMFIEVQMFNLALLPLFRQTLVGGWCFYSVVKFIL